MNINLLIGGKDVAAKGKATFTRKDPVTNRKVTVAAAASEADAKKAVEAAAKAFPAWSETSPAERRALLLKAADTLQAKAGEFADLAVKECGATPGWGHFNTAFAASLLREAAAMTTQITGEVVPSNKPGTTALAMRQPVGVCLGIAPWNAPVILGVRAIAMPLACGNTVILKSSENCPATHHLIGKALQEAGIPDGVVNVVSNAPKDAAKVVEAMIAHPAVRRVNFTGSTKVGRIIAQTAARYLKPVLLELGGKAPLVILDDANLKDAVDATAFGAFMNQGQICMSTERVIVDEAVADEFVKKLAAKARKLPWGNPRDKGVILGALVSGESADHVEALIRDAKAKGARVVTGGKRDGAVMNATVVDRVTPEMRIYHEESFGPIVAVIRGKGDRQLLRIANDSDYGLSSSVFSQDINRAMAAAKQVQAGICHINGPTVQDEGQMPFGGVKDSGYGRFGGKAAIDEFTELRWVTIESQQHYPF